MLREASPIASVPCIYEELKVPEGFLQAILVFIQLPPTRERACDETGDFAITTDPSVIHPCDYVLFCSLKILFLALVSMEKVLYATPLPFAYILLMSEDSIFLRMLDCRGFQTYSHAIKFSTSNCR